MFLAHLPPFQRLPLEMRIELFAFLKQDDLKSLRLADRTADHAIRYGRLCHFEEWLLSDRTCKFILNSRSKVQSIHIKDFLKPRRISANRGTALQNALEIILGKNIGSANLTKILQQVGNVRTLWMDEPGKKVLEGFVRSTVTFQYLTTLELFLGNTKYESDFMCALADPERVDFKFPRLKELNFSWIPAIGHVNRFNSWRSYVALHKLLWIHRATVISIDWNLDLLDGMDTPPEIPTDPRIIAEAEAFRNLSARLSEVTRLKQVKLIQINWEGHAYWTLNSQILEAQTELNHLSLKSWAFNDSEVGTVETVATKNASSLVKVELELIKIKRSLRLIEDRVCYNLPNLRNCHALKDLLIGSFSYNPLTFIGTLPPGLTHLSISNGVTNGNIMTNQRILLHPAHYEPVVQWIVNNLQDLKSLNMIADYPTPGWTRRNIHYCKIFMNRLPHLERLSIELYKFLLYGFTTVLKASIGKEGVIIELENDINRPYTNPYYSSHSAFHCSIDRSTFTPYPID